MLAHDNTALLEPVTGWRWSLLAALCVLIVIRIGFSAHAGQPAFGSGVAVGRVADGSVTTYFRTTFDVTDPSALATLQLTLLFDDGVAVFLNGTEVLRQHLDANAGHASLATAENSQFENVWLSYLPSPATLRPVENTLAVEVHRYSRGEADLSFDLQLASVPAEAPLRFTSPPVREGASWRLVFSGPIGSSINVEGSSKPAATAWQNLGRVTLTNGSGSFLHSPAEGAVQFYRLRP
jgi:hypothetical protein